MERPSRFEDSRYLGDKRTQRVYDLDSDDPDVVTAVEEIMRTEAFTSFAPDRLDEARNRGYRLHDPARTAAED